MATPLQGTESAANAVTRIKYSHDAMIDLVIANPGISQGEIATKFGFTQAWISRVFCSDAFQARLAERKTELIDPGIVASIEVRMQGLAMQSLDVISQKLEATRDVGVALKALELTSKSLGYGARQEKAAVQANFVVHMPSQAPTSAAWASANGGGVMEAEIREVD